MVTLRADENWIEFTIRYIVDHHSRIKTKNSLYIRILEEIDASAGRIRIATASIELLAVPGPEGSPAVNDDQMIGEALRIDETR